METVAKVPETGGLLLITSTATSTSTVVVALAGLVELTNFLLVAKEVVAGVLLLLLETLISTTSAPSLVPLRLISRCSILFLLLWLIGRLLLVIIITAAKGIIEVVEATSASAATTTASLNEWRWSIFSAEAAANSVNASVVVPRTLRFCMRVVIVLWLI